MYSVPQWYVESLIDPLVLEPSEPGLLSATEWLFENDPKADCAR